MNRRGASGVIPTMSEPSPTRISVTFNVTADDYARYAACIDRRSRGWTSFNSSVVVIFCAIPVALLFRALAAQQLHDPAASELAGHFSLFSFVLGVIASWIGSIVLTRVARKRYFEATVDSREPRTAELDHSGITVTGKATQSRWQWTAINRCTLERRLLLLWIAPSTAVAIPSHAFASFAAREQAQAFIRARLSEAAAAASAASDC